MRATSRRLRQARQRRHGEVRHFFRAPHRQFGHVRTAHHHRNAGRSERVGGSISTRNHARHGADADQAEALFLGVSHEFAVRHRSRISILEQHFMSRWCNGFQQEHPKMRHEISGNAIVGIVEQYLHCSRRCSGCWSEIVFSIGLPRPGRGIRGSLRRIRRRLRSKR